MAINKVREYLSKWNVSERILEFEVSSATVDLAAKAVGCEPKRIAKSLSFLVKENPILIVTAGDAKIDNKKFKTIFESKAKMINKDDVEKLIGYDVGGVCPFGINENVEVYLDESLKRFKTVFPACGTANSAIEVDLIELETFSNYKNWIDVCKDWE
ncbi:YbaK/EbsC family protein [Peptostreptococcaceae bacterium AGR-M142]|nr:YbaK/EbsC family protein [Peptostreptococcaceae bacterium]